MLQSGEYSVKVLLILFYLLHKIFQRLHKFLNMHTTHDIM